MSGGINSYRFKLQYRSVQEAELEKRSELTRRLKELGVKVNQPDEMSLEQLELLVNHHRTTVEKRITQEQLEVARLNGLTKDDVHKRVDDLNWDVDNAVKVKKVKETKAERRHAEKRKWHAC